MVHKHKPYKLYLSMILYYLFLFMGLFYINSVLVSFSTGLLEATLARSIRDILFIISIPQYIFVFLIVIRAIGFDIKKFDFASDLKEMNLSSTDAEEFELNINFDSYKAKRDVHRTFREFIYYIKENKFVIICLSFLLVVAIIYLLVSNIRRDYDQNYGIGKTFTYNNISLTVEDSLVTNLDYNGNIISDNYYVVVKMNLVNNSGYSANIDYNNFKLLMGNELINPTINMSSNFLDYASTISGSTLKPGGSRVIAVVYEIKSTEKNRDMKLQIYNGTTYVKGESIDKHIFIKLKNNLYDNVTIVGNYNLNEEVLFNSTFLENSKIIIKDYSLAKNYLYEYSICSTENNCTKYNDMVTVSLANNRQDNILLILDTDFNLDNNTNYYKNYKTLPSFAENFIDIQYRINEEIYNSVSINVTPKNIENKIIFEVPKDIENADIIQAIITIRNKEYIVNIKL